MNILFFTLLPIGSLTQNDIYSDLMCVFIERGHNVTIVSPIERRHNQKTTLSEEPNALFLQVKTLNNTKINFVEKAVALLSTPILLEFAVKKFCKNSEFDLIVYSTPPITFAGSIKRLKRYFNAKTYLMLKDIWPQTAVDLGAFRINSAPYLYLRRKERLLYNISDYIGCMSQGNIDCVKLHNPSVNSEKLELCPNALKMQDDLALNENEKNYIRTRYHIPDKAILFVYGGNLGIPQDIDFILQVLAHYKNNDDFYFLLVGSGTEYKRLELWVNDNKPANITLQPYLPKTEYVKLLKSADVGLVFLNRNFTVPNIPSRTLDYLQSRLPVLAAIDKSTDYGKIISEAGFGLYSHSGDLNAFSDNLEKLVDPVIREKMGALGYEYLKNNWSAEIAGDVVLKHFI